MSLLLKIEKQKGFVRIVNTWSMPILISGLIASPIDSLKANVTRKHIAPTFNSRPRAYYQLIGERRWRSIYITRNARSLTNMDGVSGNRYEGVMGNMKEPLG